VAEVGRLRLVLAELLVRRLDQVSLDAELADAEPLVRVELHRRPRHEREALAARVLEQVVRQLLLERPLVARELLAVGRREEDHVLVRHVRARDRDHLALLHLLGELARELHGLHARAEGAAEGALHDRLELGLEIA
jgi:hypothetical protein